MDALVSRYRPRVFGEVFGQDYPVRILSELIKRGRICRNLLLYGSVGSGKTTLARIYGMALNCDSPPKMAHLVYDAHLVGKSARRVILSVSRNSMLRHSNRSTNLKRPLIAMYLCQLSVIHG